MYDTTEDPTIVIGVRDGVHAQTDTDGGEEGNVEEIDDPGEEEDDDEGDTEEDDDELDDE